MDEENFFEGLLWGTLFSLPLWMAIIGWLKLIINM